MTAPNESPVQMGKGSADELAPLSLSRVEESLARHGYAFVEDEEHPEILRARFDDYRFQFMISGDEHGVLQTRGRWSHSVDVSRKVEMIKLCNEWNMNRIWPKVYVRRESEGLLGVYGELAADFRAGALDSQIDNAITCGLSTVIAFFHSLEERLGAELDDLDS
ncbi:YbjN domain-containing protein [Brachybacterium avium]|nr:YbjN domain-containing protein [Brachybacterium avium]